MRRAAKKDNTQTAIVKALRANGYEVTVLNQEGIPDLMVTHRWWVMQNRPSYGFFMLLETKSKRRKDGSVILDKRQEKQAAFCERFGVAYVTTPEEALEALP
jgi:hypothetical protein